MSTTIPVNIAALMTTCAVAVSVMGLAYRFQPSVKAAFGRA